jgi:hypothetical protein
MKDPHDMKKREFLAKTKLVGYDDTPFAIIDRILDHGCGISCDDTGLCSRCAQRIDDPTVPDHIYIAFGRTREKPLYFVWEILHEFGHHLSGKPSPGEDGTVAREELAWDHAAKEIERYPPLGNQIDDFLAYREYCLVNYRKGEQDRRNRSSESN